MSMTDVPWNIKCAVCGYRWYSRGRFVEDFLCFRCQGWEPDSKGHVQDPHGLAALKRELAAKMAEAL